MKVLLAESSDIVVGVQKEILKSLGMRVSVATDLDTAMILYGKNNYDLVLTCYRLKPVNGVILVSKIKNINPDQLIYYWASTNYFDIKSVEDLVGFYADGYIDKLCSLNNLVGIFDTIREKLKQKIC